MMASGSPHDVRPGDLWQFEYTDGHLGRNDESSVVVLVIRPSQDVNLQKLNHVHDCNVIGRAGISPWNFASDVDRLGQWSLVSRGTVQDG